MNLSIIYFWSLQLGCWNLNYEFSNELLNWTVKWCKKNKCSFKFIRGKNIEPFMVYSNDQKTHSFCFVFFFQENSHSLNVFACGHLLIWFDSFSIEQLKHFKVKHLIKVLYQEEKIVKNRREIFYYFSKFSHRNQEFRVIIWWFLWVRK